MADAADDTKPNKALYLNGMYPVAVAAQPPSLAQQCAALNKTGAVREGFAFTFGIDSENTAAQLRKLADLIDAKLVLPQEVIEVTKATGDDFTMTWLTLQYAMRAPIKAPD